jgi:hypothetical protein
VKSARDWTGTIADFLKDYRYQPNLTPKLDQLPETRPIDQNVINQIVLWKVNRYVSLEKDALDALNGLVEISYKDHKSAETALLLLLKQRGIDLPMASTLMRFRNPAAFQIIDRRAYRAIYGDHYPLYSTSGAEKKVDLYFSYLDELVALSDKTGAAFKDLDRILYVFDKDQNAAIGLG